MVEVNRIIVESGSFEMALERVLDTVKKVVGAEGAALLLYDEESQCLELQKPAYGSYDDRLVQLYRVTMAEDVIAVRVFQTGRPFISNNVPSDARFLHRVTPIVGIRNNLSVPVTLGNRCIGVFHVVNKPQGFDDRDVEVVSWLVSQLAVAVANARLLCRVKAQEARARALYELAMEFNLRDLHGLVRLVPQKICAVLRFPLAAVALAEGEGEGRIAAEAGIRAGLVGRLVPLGPAEEEVKELEEGELNPLEQEAARLGMVTQLRVPVPPGTGTLGRLWAWSDRKRFIYPSERRFVSLVAYLLGMALETASLYRREKETASRLHRYLELNEQLVRLVLEGVGVQRITDVVARFLGARVVFADHRLVKRAWAPGGSSELRDLDLSFLRGASGPPFLLPAAAVEAGGPPSGEGELGEVMVAPVETGGKSLGYLVVLPPVARQEELRAVIQRVIPVYALEMLKEQIASEVLQSVEGDFVGGLLSGKYSDEEVLRRASSLGYDFTGPVVVMVAEQGGNAPGAAGLSWRRWLGEVRGAVERLGGGGLAVAMQEQLVLIMPCPDANQLRQLDRLRSFAGRFREELARLTGGEVYVGIGRVVQSVTRAKTSYRDARFTLEYLRKVSPEAKVLAFHELGIYQVLAYEGASEYLMEFAYELLGPVLEMDRTKGTEYLRTLDRYYATGGSLKATADSLYCHVNTVRYRLERIRELLPYELDSPEHRFTLEMALRLLKFHHPELF
jgi:purine catabolism regulator